MVTDFCLFFSWLCFLLVCVHKILPFFKPCQFLWYSFLLHIMQSDRYVSFMC